MCSSHISSGNNTVRSRFFISTRGWIIAFWDTSQLEQMKEEEQFYPQCSRYFIKNLPCFRFAFPLLTLTIQPDLMQNPIQSKQMTVKGLVEGPSESVCPEASSPRSTVEDWNGFNWVLRWKECKEENDPAVRTDTPFPVCSCRFPPTS